jgi:DNA-directed RNA polymerase specialized sigma24 family protein
LAANVSHHALRARSTPPSVDLDSSDAIRVLDERAPTPIAALAVSELSRSLKQAVAELPAGCRDAVAAFYLDGLSYDEASRDWESASAR